MSVIGAAAEWVAAIVSGPVVTTLMTIGVACFAISMLSGHLHIRRGFQLVLGCFILVGSAEIAGALTGSIARNDVGKAPPDAAPIDVVNLPPLGPETPPAQPRGNPFDPYAGGQTVQ